MNSDPLQVGRWVANQFGNRSVITAIFMMHAVINENYSVSGLHPWNQHNLISPLDIGTIPWPRRFIKVRSKCTLYPCPGHLEAFQVVGPFGQSSSRFSQPDVTPVLN